MKPTERFSGLAQIYQTSRPSYPKEAIDFVVGKCKLSGVSLLIDVGCGTGISSRLFADHGINVIGIEPNDDMRETAEEQEASRQISGSSSSNAVVYRSGTAENTGLPDACADAILSAQAFHWFNAELALNEFHRILKSEGSVILIWNERDESDPFTRGYGDAFRKLSDTFALEGLRAQAGQPLLHSRLFADAERFDFKNAQVLDSSGLLGRAFSASYAPREGPAKETLKSDLESLFAAYNLDGSVKLIYTTSVYIARKPI